MNHRPFEEWLLNDKHLTPTDKSDLDAHLRTCNHCSALAETGLALRSARAVAPATGFVIRFQQRLAVEKIAERRRKLRGLIALILAGVGMIVWVLAPYLFAILSSPVEWLTATIGYFLFVVTSLQAFKEALVVLARILPNFVPPYVWMVIISALSGLGLLWLVSIWRFAHTPQGVSV